MPIVSGQVLFNSNNPAPTTGTAISGVQVALVNAATGNGLIITTDASGNYSFGTVPAGVYAIVEVYGSPSSGVSPGDFSNATPIVSISPADPPITAVPSPPAQANLVHSLSPNTMTITMALSNITGKNFIDGPVEDIPITKLDMSLIGSNLITGANNGNWGTVPNGTPPGTAPIAAPYPANVTGFTYTLPTNASPQDGQYSVLNVSNYSTYNGNWYNTADHTSRDETGRYLLAGAAGSAVIFTQTMAVTPNTYYVFSGWVMNPVRILGTIPSQLTIVVTGGSTGVLYQQSLLSIQPQTVLPIWNESATLFNSGSNSSITFQMLSTGGSGGGNDYIIDDLVIQQANVNTILASTKSVDKNFAAVGDTLNYTVVLNNTGQSTVENIVFSDTIPTGTTFVTGSVKVNNTTFAGFNPTPPGFTLTSPSTMATGSTVTITFSVVVNTIPTVNPIPNSSVTNYYFQPIVGGATVPQGVLSNTVNTEINQAELRTSKTSDLAYVTLGDIITYTIPIGNFGSTIANNVVFKDTIPNGTTLVPNSVIINGNPLPNTTPNPPGINIGSIAAGATTTVQFQVLVTSVPTPNPIPNSANATYSYTVDPTIPTVKTGAINTNIVTSQFNLATISTSKIVNKAYANVGDILTYTIPITNTGNVTAMNLLLTDTIPNGVTYISNSLQQDGVTVIGVTSLISATLPINVPSNKTSTLTFKVQILTIPSPNPIPNIANVAAQFTIDSTTTPNRYGESQSNTNYAYTQVNTASLGNITKAVDKIYATCGDTITYTIVVPNSGNVTALNVVIKDTLPNGTTFVTNSVYVNGIQQTGASPVTGITIPNITPGGASTINFSVLVQC